MRVLMISPCGLPIPAVKGGAVLTLIESLIRQNELKNRMELTIVGIYNQDAIKESKKYVNTKFLWIKAPKLFLLIDNIYEFIYEKVLNKYNKNAKRYAFKLFAINKFKKILKRNDYDIVVFQNAGYILKVLKDSNIIEKYKGKMFYHIHNDIPDNIFINGLYKCNLLLISSYLKKKIIKVCGSEIEKQLITVKNGFDCSIFTKMISEEEKEIVKKSIGIDNNKKIILFAGRIDPTKGIEQLTDAFAKIQRKDVVLLVIGSHNFAEQQVSPFLIKMQEKFAELSGSVFFTGYIPYSEMWKYYKIADIAVLPSMWEEPAGLTMIEASVAEVPLITTYSGGIPEYLSEEHVRFVKRDHNIVENIVVAIDEVFDNYDYWKERARLASAHVQQNYTEDRFYERFCNSIGV